MTFEEPHVAEYHDTTQRAPAGKKIVDMLLAGELDAVLGDRSNDPRSSRCSPIRTPKPRPGVASTTSRRSITSSWSRRSLAQNNPAAVEEIYRMLCASKDAAKLPAGAYDPVPFGVEANRKALELIIDYAAQQQLIPRRFTVDELFDDTTRRMN